MARTFAKLYVSVWDAGSDFYDLTADAQWLYWTLLSDPRLSPAGVLPLQPRKWAKRAKGMTERRTRAALEELMNTDLKLMVDEDTEEVLIRAFIGRDLGYRTPNIRKSIEASLKSIESQTLRDMATHSLTLAVTHSGRDGSSHDG